MNGLSKFLVDSILNESVEQVIALFGGGFKPPTKGHLEVVLKGLQQSPEVNKLKILVGQKERDGFTQNQAVKIWNFYNDINLIPVETEVISVDSPYNYYKKYLREHPDDKVYVFLGSREDNEGDQVDVKQRSKFLEKYSDNVIPLEVSTLGSTSGTEARKLFKTDIDNFRNMFPENLTDGDFEEILNILGKKELDIEESLTESPEDKILYAFDLDDTLITSKSYVIVTNPEQGTFKLTPAEYALYEPGPEDELDFSEFAHLKNPRVIKDNFELFSQILSKSSQLTGAKTIILTARQPEVSIDLEKFLEKKNLPQVTLHAVGSSDPNKKLNVIQDYINNGFNKIRFYDDSPKNVKLIKSLNSPKVDVIAKLVSQGPLAEILKEESDPFGLIQLVNEIIEEEEFNYEFHIDSLNDYMIKNEMNVTPLPSLVFINDDVTNAQEVMGKTAFYDPNKREIVLYTLYRHPKDVLRSYAHEMIHHIQNLEDRLGNITTTNTREDDNLTNLEREAYTDGNLAFRKWTETLTEGQLSTLSLKKSFETETKDYKFNCNCG